MLKTSILLLLAGLCACRRSAETATSTTAHSTDSAREAAPRSSASPSGSAIPAATAVEKWDFEADSLNAAPVGFSFARTGGGREGRWMVRSDDSSPSGSNVVAQVDVDDTNFRFTIAVANEPSLRDVRVGVRCKMISGKVDQACGLVARYVDRDNYYVTRANALENNVRLYAVSNGRRSEIANFSGTVTPNAWHEYRFELRGDHLEVFWNGTRVIDHRDSTFMKGGQAGIWTKADSVTHFDDFSVEAV